jgi:D-alanine-D-alanine ligase
VNTIPGLSYESNFASVASQAGLSHGDIVLALLHEALLHEALHRAEREVPLPSWPPLT